MLTNSKIDLFLHSTPHESPCLVIDMDIVERQYRSLMTALPFATCHYSVKTNPAPEVIKRLMALGSSFEMASIQEIDFCFSLGITPEQSIFGNTIKKSSSIAEAYAKGIRTFVFDSPAELDKIKQNAPGANVICRIGTSGAGSSRPLSRKFGCQKYDAQELLVRAKEFGLIPYGISFHVGSQQLQPNAWREPIGDAAEVYTNLKKHGITLQAIDLGGGFPGVYLNQMVPPISDYGRVIGEALHEHFPEGLPKIIIEPGRYIVAEAGVIETEVVLISENRQKDGRRWVYLDIGKYNGLAEAKDIAYPIVCDKDGSPKGAVVIAGPTCDSLDIVYETIEYQLPLSLAVADKLYILSAGAYTTMYTTAGCNGFPPLKYYCI